MSRRNALPAECDPPLEAKRQREEWRRWEAETAANGGRPLRLPPGKLGDPLSYGMPRLIEPSSEEPPSCG